MRHITKHTIALIALSLIAGCSYSGLMKPWIGESAEGLVARWGAPATTTALPDGGSVMEYHDSVRPGISGFPALGPSPLDHTPPYAGATVGPSGPFPSEATFGRSDPQSFVARGLEDLARSTAFADAGMRGAMEESMQTAHARGQPTVTSGGFVPAKGKLPCTTRFTIDASHVITKVVAEGGGCNQGWYLQRIYFTKHRVRKAPAKAAPDM